MIVARFRWITTESTMKLASIYFDMRPALVLSAPDLSLNLGSEIDRRRHTQAPNAFR
jgi:hypothetical protein